MKSPVFSNGAEVGKGEDTHQNLGENCHAWHGKYDRKAGSWSFGNMSFATEKWTPRMNVDIRMSCALPETNIFDPENGWLEDFFPFGMAYFQGPC